MGDQAVSYPVSAALITVLTTLLLGFDPSLEDPTQVMGTKAALTMSLWIQQLSRHSSSCRSHHAYT